MNRQWNTPWKMVLALMLLTAAWPPAGSSHATVQAAEAGADVQQLTMNRTKKDIVNKWMQYRPMATGGRYMPANAIYEEAPSLKEPYSPGKLKPTYIADGLNAANFVRYLAGLPDDLTADWQLERQQQSAALVNAANNVLSHYPAKPAGMDQALFDLGYAGTSSSNLFKGSRTFYSNVLGYMADSDPSNIDRVGHRRWILNPLMKQTMFGMVYANADANGYAPPYASMHAFNAGRGGGEVPYDYVAWPSAGWFPQEMLAPRDAWSVSMNPVKYDNSRTGEIQVTLTRQRDGRVWTFDEQDKDKTGRYFNVETGGYGIPFAVIFRPDDVGSYDNNDTFVVRISGLYGRDGDAAEVTFKTAFFQLLPQPTPRYMIKLRKGESLQLGYRSGAQASGNTWTSSDTRIATVNGSGVVKAVAKGTVQITVDDYLGSGAKEVYMTVTDAASSERVGKWATEDYALAKGNGLVESKYDHSYQKPISRYDFAGLSIQMMETVLERYLYTDDVGYGRSPFKDVDDWRVTWANRNGIIKGTSGTTFSPVQTITREQAATLLLNVYSKVQKMLGKQPADAAVSQGFRFADHSKIAGWAKENVYQAVSLKLMDGTGYNQFTPKGILTYEQTFVLLQKAFEVIEKDKQ